MNIPKHTDVFAKEMKRRNYCDNTIKNYSSNIAAFFKYFDKKEHPLHVNESDIKEYLSTFKCTNTQRSNHGAIKMIYTHISHNLISKINSPINNIKL